MEHRRIRGQAVKGAVLAVTLLLGKAGAAQQGTLSSDQYVSGEILIKFSSALGSDQRDGILSARGASRIRRFAALDIDHVRGPAGMNVAAAVTLFRAVPGIVYAEPNYIRSVVASPPPNDPMWLNDTLWGMQRIQAQQAWARGTGDGSVVIANLDTGMNYNHQDLAANAWRNPLEIPDNNIDDDGNGYIDDVYGINTYSHSRDPMDDNGHGTHTSGILAAVGNNGIGVVGINWNAKVLTCKFANASGSGSDSAVIECLNYIVDLKNRGENIRVSNNSWGSPFTSGLLQSAFDWAGAAGIINICAAGNLGSNNDSMPFYPASFASPSIVSVAASDQTDNLASFSSYGPTSVDLAAPGVAIMSTYGSGYDLKDGTSMATPHVAGSAALLAFINPRLTVALIKSLLLNNVDHFPQLSSIVVSGGRLNLFRAVSAANVSSRTNVALASNGGIALPSSAYNQNYPATATNDGDRRGLNWGAGGGWNDSTVNSYPDWLEIDFNGAKTIEEIDVFTVQDNYAAPSEPTSSMTFTQYGLRDFQLQYWTGVDWQNVPAGGITNNSLVWRQLLVGAITTSKIRVYITNALAGYSRITEVEAWAATSARANVALPANGGIAIASSTFNTSYPAGSANDGDRRGMNWGASGGWNDGTANSYPDWLEIDFNGAKALDEIDVFTVQDNYASPAEPTLSMSFSSYGIRDFEVQYWSGTAWQDVPGGAVTNNSKVWRQFFLSPITTTKVRVYVTSALNGYTRITEMEAWGVPASSSTNFALASNGSSVAVSSTSGPNYPPESTIDGDRRGMNWGNGGGWNDGTANTYPDWLEITFNGSKVLDEIDVFTVQDNYSAPINPTPAMTFSMYGVRDFQVQFWSGTAWQDLPGGVMTNNTLVWRQFPANGITTTKIRIYITNALGGYSRLTEVEAWGH
jgi:subtilisin family serine protease